MPFGSLDSEHNGIRINNGKPADNCSSSFKLRVLIPVRTWDWSDAYSFDWEVLLSGEKMQCREGGPFRVGGSTNKKQKKFGKSRENMKIMRKQTKIMERFLEKKLFGSPSN